MGDVVGSLMVEAGLDLTKFDASVKTVPAITSQHFERMSAEMKRTTREGAESLRLIDEALGVHLSRPLTRIIAQIPGVGTALQGLLGGAAFGAFAVAGVEFFDKMVEKIERAQKAEEELTRSSEKAQQTYASLMASYDKSDVLRSLSGLDKQIKEIDYASLERAVKGIGELSSANQEMAAKAAVASGIWTRTLAEIGNAWDGLSGKAGVDSTNKQFGEFRKHLDDIAIANQRDPLKGLREALDATAEATKNATTALAVMESMKLSGSQRALSVGMQIGGTAGLVGFSQAEIDQQKQYLDNLKEIQKLLGAANTDNKGAEDEARRADAMERQLKAAEALASIQREIGSAFGKFTPQTDPVGKLQTEIVGMKEKWDNLLSDMRAAGATPIAMRFATNQIDEAKARVDKYFDGFKRDSADLEAFQNRILQNQLQTSGEKVPDLVAPAINLPHFTGDVQAQQLGQFSADSQAQWDLIKKAQQEAISPLQKYAEELAKVNIAFAGVAAGSSLYGAKLDAVAKVEREYDEATVKAETHTEKLTKQLEEAESRADSAAQGIRAALLQLEISSATGRFTSAFSTAAIQGWEDNTIRAIERQKVNWSEYFRSLETMALKFAMNKAMTDALTNTSVGKTISHKLGIDTKSGHDAQLTALATQMTGNTNVTVANTAAIQANTAQVKTGSKTGSPGSPETGVTGADAQEPGTPIIGGSEPLPSSAGSTVAQTTALIGGDAKNIFSALQGGGGGVAALTSGASKLFGALSGKPSSTAAPAAGGAAGLTSALATNTNELTVNTKALQDLAKSISSGSMGGLSTGNSDGGDSGGDGLSSLVGGGSGEGDDDSGGSGGMLDSLIGSLTPHAAGGDVSPGQGYLVGEKGPEPFFPGVSGSIAPNSSLKGGGDTHIHNYDFSNFKGDAALMSAVQSMVEKRGAEAEQRAVVQSNERSLRTTTRG